MSWTCVKRVDIVRVAQVAPYTIEPIRLDTYPTTMRQGSVDFSNSASRGDDPCLGTGTWGEVRQVREPAELERG
jgi:hypothetical protein